MPQGAAPLAACPPCYPVDLPKGLPQSLSGRSSTKGKLSRRRQPSVSATARHTYIYVRIRPGFPASESLWFLVVNHSEHRLKDERQMTSEDPSLGDATSDFFCNFKPLI